MIAGYRISKIGEFFRPVLFTGAVEFSHECLHAVEAGFVERLKDVERREQERARPAGQVESREFFDSVPKGAKQFRPFAVLNHVLRELADVEVERDEVVYVFDFVI